MGEKVQKRLSKEGGAKSVEEEYELVKEKERLERECRTEASYS